MKDTPMWRRYLRFFGPDVNADVEDEIRFHLEMRTKELIDEGWPPSEAQAEARRLFGNLARVRSDCRSIGRAREKEASRAQHLDALIQDLRLALRQLARSPGLTGVAVLTLALGIGANTAIFSLVDSLLLRPLPYPEPLELVTVDHHYPTWDLDAGVSAPGFRDYRDRARSFASVAVATGFTPNLTGIGEPERVLGGQVSHGYFETFGIRPVLGRTFSKENDRPGDAQVAVVSHGFWQRRLGGRNDVLGRSMRLDGAPYEIVGVMPPTFVDFFGRERDVWVPVALTPQQLTDDQRMLERFRLVARLRVGVAPAAAAEELTLLAQTIQRELPGTYPPDWTLTLTSLDELQKAGHRGTLLLLFGAVGFVLLITCVNVASLLLARSMGRQKEIAIRRALGAGRGRLTRQLLTESVALALLGGTAGLAVAIWGTRALAAVGPGILTRADITPDLSVLSFTLAVSVLAGVLFGTAPALHGLGLDLQQTLKEGGQSSRGDPSSRSLRQGLVAAEFALALVLLTGAGLMIRSLGRIRAVDPGFRTEQVLTASVMLPQSKYSSPESRVTFFDRLLARLKTSPAVQAAATISVTPFSGNWYTSTFHIEHHVPAGGEPQPWGDVRTVSTGFFQALDIPLLKGRVFEFGDGPQTGQVVVVNQELVRRYWPDRDPVGRRITFAVDPSAEETVWLNVVGVVGNTKLETLDATPRMQVYFPYRQVGAVSAELLVRSERDLEALVPFVRDVVFSVDADQPIAGVGIMENLVAASIGDRRLLTLLLTLFAGVALLLASMGIGGVMSQMVRERLREMGVRTALGATRPALFGLVLRRGLLLATVGMVVGWVGSFALSRLLESKLYGIGALDPPTLVLVSVCLIVAAAVSVSLPAAHATRVDPILCLRAE